MKRLLWALGLGSAFVLGYLLVGVVIVLIYTKGMTDTSHFPAVDHALRLPKVVYYYLYPPTAADYSIQMSASKAVLAGLFLVINLVLYSLAAYIVLTGIAFFRRKKDVRNVTHNDEPPTPPSFNE